MIARLSLWVKNNHVLLTNTGSLIATTMMTGILGAIYWWFAARHFAVRDVGIASADISAMLFLGTLCVLGLGTLLISEIPHHPGHEAALILAALLTSGGAGAICGTIFALVAPYVSTDFSHLHADLSSTLFFALGVSVTTITIVLDNALVGLLRGDLQLWRNTIFTALKLVFLGIAGYWLFNKSYVAIFLAWVGGTLFSLLPLIFYGLKKRIWKQQKLWPDWKLLHKLGGSAIQHHILNLILLAPTTAMPVLVTILLTALTNASFYVAWMTSGFVFTSASALTMVLYAINPEQRIELARKIRLTLTLSFLVCLLGILFFYAEAVPVLSIFGASYAQSATECLHIIVLGSLPAVIKDHYVAISRMQGTLLQAILPATIGCILELALAAVGAHLNGLVGLSIGWVTALALEACYMAYPVYHVARAGGIAERAKEQKHDHIVTALTVEQENHA